MKFLSRLLLLGLVSFTNLLAMFMILFWALGADVALHKMVVILIFYKLSRLIVITPGNLGVREWTIGGACALVGIEPGIGLISSLLIRAAQVVALTATIGVTRARRAIADRVDSYGIRK